MTACFHGHSYTHSFFEGWYFKHQSPEHTLILIPAFHLGPEGQSYASLQIILDEKAYYLPFREKDFEASTHRLYIRLGQTVFSEKGCRIHLDLPDCPIRGHLHYGKFGTPKRSFMGPFEHLPLPCFHEVLSLSHSLRGRLSVSGQIWDFTGGTGYLEKDWGTSFPDSYLWLQCGWKETPASPVCSAAPHAGGRSSRSSVMLTVASLDLNHHPVTACSSLILHEGRQYRLSTYQGGRLIRCNPRRIALRQGPYLLQVILTGTADSPASPSSSSVLLHAPQEGRMTRTIREHPRCLMRCQLYKGSRKILDEERDCGSLELV